jgi:hypothetical protein
MERLGSICKNLRNKQCNPEVKYYYRAKPIEPGEEVLITEVGKELNKIDEICKKCEYSYFEVSEKICPICDSRKVGTAGSSSISRSQKKRIRLECYECRFSRFWISELHYRP